MNERLIRYRRRQRSPGPPADSSPCTCSPTVSRRPPAGAHGAGACPSHLCWAAAERRARSPMGFPVTSARPEDRVHRSRPRRGPRLRDGQIWTMLERSTTRSVPPSQYPRRRPRPSITAGLCAGMRRQRLLSVTGFIAGFVLKLAEFAAAECPRSAHGEGPAGRATLDPVRGMQKIAPLGSDGCFCSCVVSWRLCQRRSLN